VKRPPAATEYCQTFLHCRRTDPLRDSASRKILRDFDFSWQLQMRTRGGNIAHHAGKQLVALAIVNHSIQVAGLALAAAIVPQHGRNIAPRRLLTR
jgi:hypothetical protein